MMALVKQVKIKSKNNRNVLMSSGKKELITKNKEIHKFVKTRWAHKKIITVGKEENIVTTVCMIRGNIGTYVPKWEPLHVGKVWLYEEPLVREKYRFVLKITKEDFG